MTVSANSLFHFTSSPETLISILENGFSPRYCLEDLSEAGNIVDGNDSFNEWAVPMVCFCDIPLSRIKTHIDVYGEYGIGLTKEWGERNGLNPLVYLAPNSLLTKNLLALREGVLSKSKEDPNGIQYENWMEVVSHFKPLRGKMFRRDGFIQKTFYDEREWRYVPRLSDEANDLILDKFYRLTKAEFLDPYKKDHANRRLGLQVKLGFAVSDIKYILVPSDVDVISLANQMQDLFIDRTEEDVNGLISKLLTIEQVKTDI